MTRQVLAHNDRMMLVRHLFTADWVGIRHRHPHEQLVYLVRSAIRIEVGEEAFNLHAGERFVVEGGVEHQARALKAAEVLDVFTPAREDYRPA